MMRGMKRRRTHLMRWLAAGVLAVGPVLAVLATPSAALARQDTPEKEIVDARLEGYQANPTLPGTGSGLTWVAMVFLGGSPAPPTLHASANRSARVMSCTACTSCCSRCRRCRNR